MRDLRSITLSIPEPFFCPFCLDVFAHRQADDFNHFVQCLVEHGMWRTLAINTEGAWLFDILALRRRSTGSEAEG